MRLPNGYGSVIRLSGKRRKPYAVRKTVGYNDNGSAIIKYIGYYCTRREAMDALSRYNTDPSSYTDERLTFAQAYEKWSNEFYETCPHKTKLNYTSAYKLAEPLYNMRMVEIKLDHIQETIDNSGKNEPTLKKYRSLLNYVFGYCVKHEYIRNDKKEILKYMNIRKGNPNKINRTIFTNEEIEYLKKHDDNAYCQMILILIYSGMRIGEAMALKKEDVHMDERYFLVRGTKTQASFRDVPISKKIMPYVEKWLKTDSEYLFCNEKGNRFTYRNFKDSYWKPFAQNHQIHDTRHTFDSLMVMAKVDDRWKQAILGHKLQGLDAVYTHIDLDHKIEAVDSI